MVYFSSKSDLEILEEGVKLAKKLNKILMMPNFRYGSNLGGNVIISDILQIEEDFLMPSRALNHTI